MRFVGSADGSATAGTTGVVTEKPVADGSTGMVMPPDAGKPWEWLCSAALAVWPPGLRTCWIAAT